MALLLYLGRALDYASHRPALAPAERPGLGDRHLVAHLGIVLLVVSEEFRGALLRLTVDAVLHAPLDRHDHALLHAVADDHALQFRLRAHDGLAFSFRIVWMRASSRRTLRILPGASSWPIDFWIRMRNS